MSHGRVGARAGLVAVGVLASMALMAAPSWAAKGGNSANAQMCAQEYGALVAQDGSTFKNAGACTSYAAKGRVLAKLAIQAHFESTCFGASGLGPCLRFEVSGFGLKPESAVLYSAGILEGGGASSSFTATALGTVSKTSGFAFDCPISGVSSSAQGTLASGQPITAVGTGPSSC